MWKSCGQTGMVTSRAHAGAAHSVLDAGEAAGVRALAAPDDRRIAAEERRAAALEHALRLERRKQRDAEPLEGPPDNRRVALAAGDGHPREERAAGRDHRQVAGVGHVGAAADVRQRLRVVVQHLFEQHHLSAQAAEGGRERVELGAEGVGVRHGGEVEVGQLVLGELVELGAGAVHEHASERLVLVGDAADVDHGCGAASAADRARLAGQRRVYHRISGRPGASANPRRASADPPRAPAVAQARP